MRLVFVGTPDTAVPSLDALLKSRHEVAAVITRPDAKAGRGLKVGQSPIAQRAADAGVEILRPARLAGEEFLGRLREIAPDCCPVTAYGAIIPQVALDIPRTRLGQLALLRAPGLARCGPGTARDLAR